MYDVHTDEMSFRTNNTNTWCITDKLFYIQMKVSHSVGRTEDAWTMRERDTKECNSKGHIFMLSITQKTLISNEFWMSLNENEFYFVNSKTCQCDKGCEWCSNKPITTWLYRDIYSNEIILQVWRIFVHAVRLFKWFNKWNMEFIQTRLTYSFIVHQAHKADFRQEVVRKTKNSISCMKGQKQI